MLQRFMSSLAFAVALLAGASQLRAAGPLIVNGAGQPLAWTTKPIRFNPDRGGLGLLSNSQAVSAIITQFGTWSAVATAAISFVNAGPLPVDVTAANYQQYFSNCQDSLNPIIFDTDGSIIQSMFGSGNENFILGAAGPDCISYTPSAITGASAIFNGRFIDNIQNALNPEVSPEEFNAVMLHELGHFIGLDHSQINLIEAFDGDPGNTVATMFPILIDGTQQSTLKLDDRVSVSMLYPSRTFFSSTGSIRGSILRPDGTTPFQGAYVIARQIGNPRLNAVGVASGFLYFPDSPGGPPAPSLQGSYELDGLTSRTSYTVEIEAIDPQFTGGSSVGPLDPPATVPVPEFWNGANEAATDLPDNPSAATPIAVSAGNPVTGINVVMNAASGSLPANDLCSHAATVASFPFTDSVDTTGACESSSDPALSCSTNGLPVFNTVWYAVVPPQEGIVTFDTCGSTYNTVVGAFTGSCSALTPVACNDDAGSSDPACGSTQSRVSFDVLAGQTYLVEVAQYGAPAGGTLNVNATLASRNCMTGNCLLSVGSRGSGQCMAEWLIEPLQNFGRVRPRFINCRDGDSCDFDGSGTNHSCTFHVAVCFNNHDPNLSCTPTDISLVELLTPHLNRLSNTPADTANANALLSSLVDLSSASSKLGICLNNQQLTCLTNPECNSPGKQNGRCYVFVRYTPPLSDPDRCTLAADVTVPLRQQRNGRFAAATKRLQLKATSSMRRIDSDSLKLRCLPSL